MSAVVVDTQAAVWYLQRSPRLSQVARNAIREAERTRGPVWVSAISLVEMAYLVEKGKIPEEALTRLVEAISQPGSPFSVAPVEMGVFHALRRVPRESVPEMPDRIIAATAHHLHLPLVTSDRKIASSGVITTIW